MVLEAKILFMCQYELHVKQVGIGQFLSNKLANWSLGLKRHFYGNYRKEKNCVSAFYQDCIVKGSLQHACDNDFLCFVKANKPIVFGSN